MGRFQGWAAFGCAGAIVFGSIASSGTAHAAMRSTIASSQPAWARPANRVGSVNGNTDIVVRVYLRLRDRAGLDALAAAVSNPKSPKYRHFLTTAQVRGSTRHRARRRVGAVVARVERAAVARPAREQPVRRGRGTRDADGVEPSASRFRPIACTARPSRAADQDLSVPPSLAPAVAGVIGVDEAQALLRPDHIVGNADPRNAAPPPAGFRNAPTVLRVLEREGRHDRSRVRRRVRIAAPVRAVRVHTSAASLGVRPDVDGRRWSRRSGRDGRDRRRVRVADDLPATPDVRGSATTRRIRCCLRSSRRST